MNFQKSENFSHVIAAIALIISAPFVSANEMNGNMSVSWERVYIDQLAYSSQWAKIPVENRAFDKDVSSENHILIGGIKDLIKGAGSDKGGDKNNRLYMDMNNGFSGWYSISKPEYTAPSEMQPAALLAPIQGVGDSTKNTGVVISDEVAPVVGPWVSVDNIYQGYVDVFVVELNESAKGLQAYPRHIPLVNSKSGLSVDIVELPNMAPDSRSVNQFSSGYVSSGFSVAR